MAVEEVSVRSVRGLGVVEVRRISSGLMGKLLPSGAAMSSAAIADTSILAISVMEDDCINEWLSLSVVF